jgi:hypothetical protein
MANQSNHRDSSGRIQRKGSQKKRRVSTRVGSSGEKYHANGRRITRQANAKEKQICRFIADQIAVTIGQLCVFTGLSKNDVEYFVEDFKNERWVDSKQFITGDEELVWLRKAGFRVVGVPARNRLGVHYNKFEHVKAITDARLWMEENYDIRRWFPEGNIQLGQKGRRKGIVPDAVALVKMEKNGAFKDFLIAIEVQISNNEKIKKKIESYPRKYQGIIYFVVPKVRRQYDWDQLIKKHPRLAVRDIPEVFTHLSDRPAWQIPGDPTPPLHYTPDLLNPPLSEGDVVVLDLLADQGCVPMDQLLRFLGMGEAKEDLKRLEGLVSRLVNARLVRRAKPLVDKPIWVYLTSAGRRMARKVVDGSPPCLGRLELRYAINEIRLDVTEGASDDAWVSGRVLRREHGMRGSVPDALIKRGDKRIAIDVIQVNHRVPLECKWTLRQEKYDEVHWYFPFKRRTLVMRFAEELNSPKLKVFPLPHESRDMKFPFRPKSVQMFQGDNAALWTRLTRLPPLVVLSIPVEELPLEVLQVIGIAAKRTQVPVTAVWKSPKFGLAVFCVQTEVGTFRVAQTVYGWKADELVDKSKPIDELIFKKEGSSKSLAMVIAANRERQKAGTQLHYEVDDELWAIVKPLIPFPPSTTIGKRKISDRAILSALIFILRHKIGWKQLPQELGYGHGFSVRKRWKRWTECPGWDEVVRALTEGLPDGNDLDWSRLSRKGGPGGL